MTSNSHAGLVPKYKQTIKQKIHLFLQADFLGDNGLPLYHKR